MNRIKLAGRPSHVALVLAATAVLAAGCNRTQTAATTAPPLDALPLTTGDTPTTPAPATSALPAAAPARIARLVRPQDGYAYLDRAYAASDGYADAPPDYAVDYNGERPWIWRGGDNSERVVERTPEGLRYYYYEPGASEPYLVQDPDYGYAYSDGQLVAVYGLNGQLEPYSYQQRYADRAGRYLAWAAALYAASVHQQRFSVEQEGWRQQQAYIAGQRNAWAQQQTRYPAWNDYHQAHAQEEAAHWAPERDRRQAEIVRYNSVYQSNSYQNNTYQSSNYNNSNQNNVYRGAPSQGAASQGQYRQAGQPYGQPGGYLPARAPQSGYGYDPNAARNAAAQAEASRRSGFDQRAADVQAQRQTAEQAHAGQMQALQAQQAQARAAEAQRQASLQQGRAAAQAQHEAAEQAHAAQLQAQRAQQDEARAAEGQRRASLEQARAASEAQRQAAQQAHAAQQGEARAQAAAERQAAAQQAQAARAQRQAAQQAHAAQEGEVRTQAAAERQAAAQQAQAAQAQRQAAAQQARAAQAQHAVAARPPEAPQHAHEGPHGEGEHRPSGEQR